MDTYEKKYKALVEAVKTLKEANPSDEGIQNWVNNNIPELKESEDEKVKKALIRFHKSTIDIDGIKGADVIAWLEKQGEQKPAWSEEDELMFLSIIQSLELTNGAAQMKIEWLKSIRHRNTWKPSDKQMHYLSWIANVKLGDSVVEQEVSKHLNELLEDLKKLTE